MEKKYRKSGNFHVKNISCENISCLKIFVGATELRKIFNTRSRVHKHVICIKKKKK